MASDTTIGGVGILISGDYSKLASDFATAQGIAASGANAIGSSVSAAFSQASPIVDQFGRSIQGAGAAAQLAGPQMATLNDVVAELSNIQAALASTTTTATTAIRAQSAALHGSVSEIQATSGALRVLEGSGGIRAAERFLTMIPGLGAALQVGFPLIGLIALYDMFERLVGKTGELSEAEKNLAEVTKQNDTEWARLAGEFERIKIDELTTDFGKLAGIHLKGFYDAATAERDRGEIKSTATQIAQAQKTLAETEGLYSSNIFVGVLQALNPLVTGMRMAEQPTKDQILNLRALQDTYGTLTEKLRIYDAQAALDKDVGAKTAAEEAGQLQGARLANQEQANQRLGEMARQVAEIQISQSHASAQAGINAMHDTGSAAVASAAEELRVAQAKETQITAILAAELPKRIALIRQQGAAESAGKSAPEQANIQTQTAGKVSGAEDTAASEAFAAHAAVVRAQGALDEAQGTRTRKLAEEASTAWRESYDAIMKAAKETSDIQAKSTEAAIVATAKVMEIEAKGKGQTDAVAVESQKLVLERAYGLEVVHTAAQQVAYQTQLAALDDKSRTAKLTGLAAELQIAEVVTGTLRDETKLAELKAQIALLSVQDANASYAANTKNLELAQKLTLQYQLAQEAQRVPAAIGNAAAKGIVDGKNIGQDIRNSLKGIGQEMLGSVFTRLISAIVTQGGMTALLTGATVAHTAATTANVAVTGANVVATGTNAAATTTNAAATIGHIIATEANIIATNLNTFWLAIKAVFGFAGGGSPPVGIASIVGERGPELFIPHQAGTIIPAGMFNAPNVRAGLSSGPMHALPSISNSSSSQSSSMGDVHIHINGAQSPRETARAVATYLKNASPKFSPYSK